MAASFEMGDEPEFHTGRTEHQAREHRLRRACVCATREGRSAHSMLLMEPGASVGYVKSLAYILVWLSVVCLSRAPNARFLLPSTRGVLESEPGDVEVA